TPLNAIIGFGQLLDMDQEDPLSDNQKIAVREVLRGGNHLVSLVDQVLDLSGIESGNLPMAIRAVESRPVVDECIALISGAALDRGLTLHVVGQTVEYMVKADPVRLKQVLLNLLMNAVKYNTTGKKWDWSWRDPATPNCDSRFRMMVLASRSNVRTLCSSRSTGWAWKRGI
ncbi:MAG: HAMP domain-containing sensor histidine kinase, partial [Alphaproteobacteria bacterium]|nr:HAMP domain-containing sensor histidine kinase [Alphaproteobacteria bacterium]